MFPEAGRGAGYFEIVDDEPGGKGRAPGGECTLSGVSAAILGVGRANASGC